MMSRSRWIAREKTAILNLFATAALGSTQFMLGSVAPPPMSDDSPVACPLCESFKTVRTTILSTRVFYFCLDCAKSFERRIEKPKQIPPSEKQST
jgi:hypothetical protein